MIKIKVTHPYGQWPLARQTPENSGIWEDCQFFINSDVLECDYWFILDDLPKEESSICPAKNTIIITLEFPAIRPNINLKFLEQFGTVLTYSRQIVHPDVREILAPFPWHIGVNNTNGKSVDFKYKNYDDFNNNQVLDKSKMLSVITSNKQYTEGHKKRLEFVKKLKVYFGENIDVFGRGINTFADKWEAIAPYKYHISLENSSCKNGVSEKLYDAFLGESFPFYYGSPNISDYFPSDSFRVIDIDNVDNSLKIIDLFISDQVYEKRIKSIRHSKSLVLNKYNIFNLMSNYCKSQIGETSKIEKTIKPESHFLNKKLVNLKNKLKYIHNYLSF